MTIPALLPQCGGVHSILSSALVSEVISGEAATDQRGVWGWGRNAGSVAYLHSQPPNTTVGDSLLPGTCTAGAGIPCGPAAGQIWQAYAYARSNHPGGVNVGNGDGHVRFVTDDVDPAEWKAFGTADGGEEFTLE